MCITTVRETAVNKRTVRTCSVSRAFLKSHETNEFEQTPVTPLMEPCQSTVIRPGEERCVPTVLLAPQELLLTGLLVLKTVTP